ncbi:hypothetical protein BAUCODRAFT_39716 [Baudoinia panamericana UAMH 10762]|uniref:Uncharacterized protein n=1 Tax=Baudoinia panamericana (strain UAMH 10762) TaxID=717646 RepID=M2LAR5_BAUPA|nr:uncharacterized protein BAUCODRAFT_39716 [Baudoinia panamericana UAMH 10762]EMC90907.1 hypothetical protein BAUCODRAFT_39716 [Baudoinia panamericana UAMH 10762]
MPYRSRCSTDALQAAKCVMIASATSTSHESSNAAPFDYGADDAAAGQPTARALSRSQWFAKGSCRAARL